MKEVKQQGRRGEGETVEKVITLPWKLEGWMGRGKLARPRPGTLNASAGTQVGGVGRQKCHRSLL